MQTMECTLTFGVCWGEKQVYIHVVTAQAGSGKICKKLLLAHAFVGELSWNTTVREISFSLCILLYLFV